MRVSVRDRIDAVSQQSRDDVVRISHLRRHRRKAMPQRVRAELVLSDRALTFLAKKPISIDLRGIPET